ncbi:MAG TPA: hypothetical protein VJR29_13835 [bacterium]|nr:hypothetical protein [bacterium]
MGNNQARTFGKLLAPVFSFLLLALAPSSAKAVPCSVECGICGDFLCDPCSEDASNCAEDCYCGDSHCDATETAAICPQDCIDSVCGDFICDLNEDCPADCDAAAEPSCGEVSICGNGILEAGEACDDGNLLDGDCCSSSCAAETGASCEDGDFCNGVEVCDAFGICAAGEELVCDDGNACTAEVCDPGEGCQYQSVVCPDDALSCTTAICEPAFGCEQMPDHRFCQELLGPKAKCQPAKKGSDPLTGCVRK